MPFFVPPCGVSASVQDGQLVCNGVPVRKVNNPGDHLTCTVLDGHYLEAYFRRRDGSEYGVVIDLDVVWVGDEVVQVDLDSSVQRIGATAGRRAA